ncbi:MAG TPA: ABC transporter permease, partial [Methylomirabilota bacterium]|nr:ABC transporter permease [Methylomirabilota bacterium]
MRLFAQGRSLLAAVFRHSRGENDMEEELRAHIAERTQDLERGGLGRGEAFRQARLEFGGYERFKDECREAGGGHFLQTLLQDLRFGFRMFRKSPAFTAVAVLTLALGIGTNTVIFSYVNAWLIKPLPYPQAERLMAFKAHDTKRGWTANSVPSTADYLDLEAEAKSFERAVAWTTWNFNLTGDGPPALVEGGRVSWGFFDALGARPIAGRTFLPEDDQAGRGHVAILGQGLWETRYASDRGIIGRSIRINDEPYTVVGVMPATFQFPLMGIANLWTPMAMTDAQRADRNNSWFSAFGKLKPGVTPAQANAECAAIFAHLEKEYPDTNANTTVVLTSLNDEIGKNEGAPQVLICFWIVGLILLIACANVANLMLARTARRVREFALRRALGATRGRLIRQLLSESVLLFLFGSVGAVLFGLCGIHVIDAAIPGHVRGYIVNYGHVGLDVTTLAFTMGIALGCGLLFGLAPAVENSRLDPNVTLKEESGQASGSSGGARLRRILVGAEVAVAVVVLVSTALLVRSFIISVRSSPGFTPANVVAAQLALPKTRYPQPALMRTFTQDVLSRLRALPQVESVGAASSVPFGGFGQGVEVRATNKPAPLPGQRFGARYTAVSTDYFATMHIRVLKGRTFTSADSAGAFPSAVIGQTLADRLWPGEDPIGQQLQFGDQHTLCTIVGVVGDVKMYNLRANPERQMYVSLEQFPSPTLAFVLRSA